MSFREAEPPRQERVADEMARARAAEPGPETEHPVPPAEGRWRGVLGQARRLLAQRRRFRRSA